MSIAPPSLPPHHSSLATRDFQSSISIEALLCGYHLDVQGLLHQQLHAPWSSMVVYVQWIGWRLEEALHIQMIPMEDHFNQDGGLKVKAGRKEQSSPTFDLQWCVSSVVHGLKVPSCWTTLMRRQAGRSNLCRPLTCLDPVSSSIRTRNAQAITITNCEVGWIKWTPFNMAHPLQKKLYIFSL